MQRRLRKLTLDVPSAGLAPSGLEKLINAAAGFADPAKFRHELAKAEMRTARVEIGGKPKGTGFLIGNSLLLRAWHVVERYDDNGGIAIFDNKVSVPGKDERQAARTVAFATEWLVARSCSLSVREAGGTPLARRTGPSGQGTNSVTEARMASNHTPELS